MKVSIVIPYHEREGSWEQLTSRVLPALNRQGLYYSIECNYNLVCEGGKINGFFVTKAGDVEVIIVGDSAVRTGTKNCCLQINRGLKAADGDIFVLLHQDVVPNDHVIETMIDYVYKTPFSWPGMVWATVYKERFPYDPSPMYWVGPRRQNEAWFMIAAERQRLVDLGGVDEDFWQFWGCEDLMALEYWKRHFTIQYTELVKATHLWHPEHPAATKCGHNMQLYKQKMEDPDYRPNKGKEWGNG